MIAIIDYGAGNLHSVKNALDFLNAESIVTGDSETILNADKVILPVSVRLVMQLNVLKKADLLKRLKLLQRAVNRFWEYVWDFI